MLVSCFLVLNLVQVLVVKTWPGLIEHSLLAGHGSFGQDSIKHGSHVRGLQLLKFKPRTERLFSLVSLISVLHIYLNSTNIYRSKNTNMTFFVKTKANDNLTVLMQHFDEFLGNSIAGHKFKC